MDCFFDFGDTLRSLGLAIHIGVCFAPKIIMLLAPEL